jgi:hypothetical protein
MGLTVVVCEMGVCQCPILNKSLKIIGAQWEKLCTSLSTNVCNKPECLSLQPFPANATKHTRLKHLSGVVQALGLGLTHGKACRGQILQLITNNGRKKIYGIWPG